LFVVSLNRSLYNKTDGFLKELNIYIKASGSSNKM